MANRKNNTKKQAQLAKGREVINPSSVKSGPKGSAAAAPAHDADVGTPEPGLFVGTGEGSSAMEFVVNALTS